MSSSTHNVNRHIGRRTLAIWLSAALFVLAAMAWGLPARAAVALQVTSNIDDNSAATYACPATNTKPCTLRLAIDVANNDVGDTINVPAGIYALTTHTELQIRASMNIIGADPRTTIIDGDSANGGHSRIFQILPNETTASIDNLTLQNAFVTGSSGGGALFNQSSGLVTLDNDAIINNRMQATGETDGAGIYSGTQGSPQMVITRSLIAGNTVLHGTDTSISSKGGAIFNQFSARMTITNSTITANTADEGGGVFNGGTVALSNDTVAANVAGLGPNDAPGGGGLVDVAPSSISLSNTIVSGNTNGDCRKYSGSGTFTSTGGNLDSDGTCFLTASTDKPSTNPKLAALALNSPGQTKTMAIDNTSPAYNNATAACPATDQRGVTRPQGSACDIGAYELVVAVVASPSPTPALPRAGSEGGGGGVQPGQLLALTAILLIPVAIAFARRRHPDDGPRA